MPVVLDGDLPKADWFAGERSSLLSDADGEIHTVVPGGPIGITPAMVAALASASVHAPLLRRLPAQTVVAVGGGVLGGRAPHVPSAPPVGHADWVRELKPDDAGWLHQFPSANGGDMRRVGWEDMNIAARFARRTRRAASR